jgi:putative spermidine/putrescine transport system substrate-binding protein
MRAIPTITVAAVLALLAGCGGGGEKTVPGELQRVGAPEGALNLVALPGYIEGEWVTPFERSTGCRVSSTVASSPEEVTRLMRSGRYDGVSARGDVSLSLVADRLVDPVNTHLVPVYAQLFPALKRLPDNTVDGVTYGIPTGRQASFLVYRTSRITMPSDEPSSSDVIFDPAEASKYRGQVTGYDNPMSIADAALYLRKHEKDLGIDNVYELDQEQFDATIRLLREQRPNVGRYWRDSRENVDNFVRDLSIVGPAWQTSIDQMLRERVGIKAVIPDEGATGLSDSWMIAAHAEHPNCMYRWLDYIAGPKANAALAENTRQAPANERACDETRDPSFCDTYHAADENLFSNIRYWATPLRDCGDGRGDSCKTYADWASAWREVTGQ